MLIVAGNSPTWTSRPRGRNDASALCTTDAEPMASTATSTPSWFSARSDAATSPPPRTM
jgi:hypothetical protein